MSRSRARVGNTPTRGLRGGKKAGARKEGPGRLGLRPWLSLQTGESWGGRKPWAWGANGAPWSALEGAAGSSDLVAALIGGGGAIGQRFGRFDGLCLSVSLSPLLSPSLLLPRSTGRTYDRSAARIDSQRWRPNVPVARADWGRAGADERTDADFFCRTKAQSTDNGGGASGMMKGVRVETKSRRRVAYVCRGHGQRGGWRTNHVGGGGDQADGELGNARRWRRRRGRGPVVRTKNTLPPSRPLILGWSRRPGRHEDRDDDRGIRRDRGGGERERFARNEKA